ncbi:type 1 glutamine amidotransferase [Paenibacillus lautus]|uniref:type 1 glutamine amidotransferase n=1 Tax=Paenibacillus lautus TaxID=1401 RepID=UPI003D26B7F7
MRIHYLQHVPFETPEHISVWAHAKGHELTGTLIYEDLCLPTFSEFDMLVILGGPMGTYNIEEYPWILLEKQFIKESIQRGKLVLGICLGAQLIAESVGGTVFRNHYKEIGWFPVKRIEQVADSAFFRDFPDEFIAFHWHADTFQLPSQAKRIAFSKGCSFQAYEYRDNVVGLQFHLESSNDSIHRMIEHCGDDLAQEIFVQQPYEMLEQTGYLAQTQRLLFTLLDAFEGEYRSQHIELLGKRKRYYHIIGD